MHYIIGTSFTAGTPTQQQGPRVVGAVQVSRTRGLIGPFENGQMYTLYNIRPINEKFEYTFFDSNRELLVVEFNNSKEADVAIAKAAGETLPDYKSFYSKSA
tara:strand:+ start:264 stop:569 length:306 start_codon:yes stop_codon:yes gene_type:complete